MTTLISVRDARANLAELLNRAQTHHERIVVTNNGKPVGVLMGIDDFESMAETLDILSNPETMAQLAESERDIAAGRTITLEPGMSLQEFLSLPDPE